MNNDELNYWEIIENNCGFELSKDFKELYFKMVSYNPNTRPDVQNIMEHPWFKQIREMDESQLQSKKSQMQKTTNCTIPFLRYFGKRKIQRQKRNQ